MFANSVPMELGRSLVVTVAALTFVTSGQQAHAQPGTVLSQQKISDTEGGFKGILDDVDFFGYSVAPLGDLDGDGVGDLAVGASRDDDGGPWGDYGAVEIASRLLRTPDLCKEHLKRLPPQRKCSHGLAPLGAQRCFSRKT